MTSLDIISDMRYQPARVQIDGEDTLVLSDQNHKTCEKTGIRYIQIFSFDKRVLFFRAPTAQYYDFE